MLDKAYIQAKEGLLRILSQLDTTTIPIETTSLEDAYERVLAENIYSPEDLPGFRRSTVDGYAVVAEDTFGASETSPRYLTIKGDIVMGVPTDITIGRGECVRVPTGGMLPEGSDAVLMFEHAQVVSEDMIEVCRALAVNENVVQADEDIKRGELVLTKGMKLRPQDVGALAGIGITRIQVFKRPVVSIISTGDEIVPPDSPLKPGQVRDINSYSLDGLIRQAGGVTLKLGIFKDDYGTLKGAFHRAMESSDLILLSGGTSAGIKDMTARIIDEAGRPGVLFHGVSVKPGKPLIGGIVGNKPAFGLPGHPAAIFVSFETFVRPVIERLSGLTKERFKAQTLKAKISKAVASQAGREDHIRVSLSRLQDGTLMAERIFGKSGLITTLVRADGVVIIPSEKLGLDAGEEVHVKTF
jgi:molybdopterin molybdotransferase